MVLTRKQGLGTQPLFFCYIMAIDTIGTLCYNVYVKL